MAAVVKKCKFNGDALGTGRRKSSVARVRVRAGSGVITINKKPFEEYFKFTMYVATRDNIKKNNKLSKVD